MSDFDRWLVRRAKRRKQVQREADRRLMKDTSSSRLTLPILVAVAVVLIAGLFGLLN